MLGCGDGLSKSLVLGNQRSDSESWSLSRAGSQTIPKLLGRWFKGPKPSLGWWFQFIQPQISPKWHPMTVLSSKNLSRADIPNRILAIMLLGAKPWPKMSSSFFHRARLSSWDRKTSLVEFLPGCNLLPRAKKARAYAHQIYWWFSCLVVMCQPLSSKPSTIGLQRR